MVSGRIPTQTKVEADWPCRLNLLQLQLTTGSQITLYV